MNRFLDILMVLLFSGFFYLGFEVVFNAIFTPQVIKKNMQDKNNDSIRDGYILLYGFTSVWMLPVGSLIGLGLFGIYCIPLFQNWYMMFVFMPITCITITLIELAIGSLFYKLFKLRIWNYSGCKYNYNGHIELWHSIGWFALGIPVYLLCAFLYHAVWL